MTGGGGVDGGEKLGDGGLGGVGGEAVTFAWWVMAIHACGGSRGGEERGWGVDGSGRGRVIQWVLAVPYVPVQGSPGVLWES